MWEWIKNLLWDAVKKIAGWFLDLFLWVFEWVFWVINEALSWLLNLGGELLIRFLDAVKGYMPDGISDNITAIFEWLVYINEWVPIKYGIGLLVAYFAIKAVLTVVHWLIKFVPFIGGS